ncbi:MAG: ABC transporter substrate-binding protein [Ardenticatenaceae bacterium]|nr:ABC transporter substrate-binding protein [Ardenticatenaceae bacterium]
MKGINKRHLLTSMMMVFLLFLAAACGGAETEAPAQEEEPAGQVEETAPEETEAEAPAEEEAMEEEAEEPAEEEAMEEEAEPEAPAEEEAMEEEAEEMMEEEERVLIIGHSEVTESYDLAHAFNPTSGIVHRASYDTLVTFPDTDASSIEPNLATSWSVSEDGLSYTFNLRDDVTFANGDPLTADDVVFSFTRLINVQSNPSFLADPIESLEAVDDLTVVINLVEPRPSFLAEMVNSAFSVANDAEVIAAGGTNAEDAASTDGAQEFLDQNSVGTGPYILESWTPQEETVLVRNPGYWGESPYFDRIIIVNIPEAATQQVALESGDIDLATDLAPDQVTGLEDDPNITVFRGQDRWTHFVLMNRDPEIGGPVSDPNVALAIRYALDYQGYTDLWTGSVTPGSNMWIGIAGAFGPDQAFERDLDRARDLLTEAGYPDGFEIELSYPDFTFGGINLSTNAQKIQADLAEVGITVSLRPGEVQVSLEEYRNGEQGFAYWFWGPDILDPVDFLSFLPGGKVAGERTNWTEDMIDEDTLALIAQAGSETDPEVRAEIFEQLQVYAQENGAYAPFNVPAIQTAFRSDIQGYIWHPEWGLDLAGLSRSN